MTREQHPVLVVEDEPDIRDLMVAILESEGYTVRAAADGAEALAQLQLGNPPCVILLDLMMPVMDGWTFCREKQKFPELAAIPVVVVSAVSNIRITKSAPSTAFDALSAMAAPNSRSGASLISLRFQAVTGCPAKSSLLAMGAPINPVPRNATFDRIFDFSAFRPRGLVDRRLFDKTDRTSALAFLAVPSHGAEESVPLGEATGQQVIEVTRLDQTSGSGNLERTG